MVTLTDHDPGEETRPIPLRDVEAELTRRVRSLQEPDEKPLLRTRMSNLVILVDEADRAAEIAEIIPKIATIHPARVLLLIATRETKPLEATVAVRERSVGSAHSGAVEWVTLRAGGPHIDDLPFAVRRLLLGNLPTNVWWAARTPAPRAGPLLDLLAEGAQVVLYDSQGWPDPARTLAATAAWVQGFERTPKLGRPGWRVVTDLNWRRMVSWRELLTQALDPACAPRALETISELRVDHGPHAAVESWLLVGWLASRLGWTLRSGRHGAHQSGSEIASSWDFLDSRGGTIEVQVVRVEDHVSELRSIRIACQLDGQPGSFVFTSKDSYRLIASGSMPGCVPRTISVTPLTLADLVGHQLSDRDFDPVFRAALDAAAAMAGALTVGI